MRVVYDKPKSLRETQIVFTTHILNMQYTHDFIEHIYEMIPLTYDVYNIYMKLSHVHMTFTTYI